MARRKGFADRAMEHLQEHQNDAEAEVVTTFDAPEAPQRAQEVRMVPVLAIAPNRNNPRKERGDLEELAGSIRDHGVLQPITVRPLLDGERDDYPTGTRYVLLMGERRWAASQVAELETVPCVIREDLSGVERQVMILENLQRRELSPVEEARSFGELLATGMSQRELARQLHIPQPNISRRLALLNLTPGLLALVESGHLGVDVAANELSKLPAEQQDYVNERLGIDDESPLGITPEAVRRHITAAKVEAERLARIAQQEKWLTDHGVRYYSEPAKLHDAATRKDCTAVYVGTSSDVDTDALEGLVGLVRPIQTEPDLYHLQPRKPAPAPQAGEQADDAASESQEAAQEAQDSPATPTQHDLFDKPPAKHVDREQRRYELLSKGIAAWVAANPKPPAKSALCQRLAEYIVGTAGRDVTWRVCGWTKGRIGCEVSGINDWDLWRKSITPKEAPTVAWLITVAADLYSARYATQDAQSFRDTCARVAEVAPELLAELGIDLPAEEEQK